MANNNPVQKEKIMHSILLVVKRPAVEPSGKINAYVLDAYHSAVRDMAKFYNTNKGIEALGENVLLIPINDALGKFVDVFGCLGGCAYKYTILHNEDMIWHEVNKGV